MRRSPLLVFIVIVLTVTYWEYAQYIVVAIIVYHVIRILLKVSLFVRDVIANFRLRDIDTMDGIEFEKYVATVLKSQGYTDIQLTEHYDYGVDIVATKSGVRWGIQVKRYSGLVKANAVRQVVTGLRMYDCQRAMVITNSVFSRVAVQLAQSNDCVLIDRSLLARASNNATRS